MIKRLLALDGVDVVCLFRDDGVLVEGFGLMSRENMARLAKFAYDYRRMVQGNADQLSMFTGMRGWAPPTGWVMRGDTLSLCGVANIVCMVRNDEGALNDILMLLQ
jgi:roadblock/LC7 domain-containing protein